MFQQFAILCMCLTFFYAFNLDECWQCYQEESGFIEHKNNYLVQSTPISKIDEMRDTLFHKHFINIENVCLCKNLVDERMDSNSIISIKKIRLKSYEKRQLRLIMDSYLPQYNHLYLQFTVKDRIYLFYQIIVSNLQFRV